MAHRCQDPKYSGNIAPGMVVYRRLWKRWCLKHDHCAGRECHFSPYWTGRVIQDLGDCVLVRRFKGRDGTRPEVVWPKHCLRVCVGPGFSAQDAQEIERSEGLVCP